jgi:calcineurin-like phosphoesterase
MEEGRSQFNGLLVELDDQTQKVTNFEVIHVIE